MREQKRGATGNRTGVHVALLRAVNVGGKNKLPMQELAALFEAAGGQGVVTYIQSGNVVFRAADPLAARMPEVVRKAIAKRFGFDPPIVVRTAADLRRIARAHPFDAPGVDPKALHVVFLAAPALRSAPAVLEAKRAPSEKLVVRGSEVYLGLPGGIGRTKLTSAVIDAATGTIGTTRNWRTVLALRDLARATKA